MPDNGFDKGQERPGRQFAVLASLFGKNVGSAVSGIILAIIQPVLLVPIPLLVNYSFNEALPGRNVSGLLYAGAAIIGLALASVVTALLSRRLILHVTKRGIGNIRMNLLNQLLTMPLGEFKERDHNRFHNLIVHATERMDVMSNALVAQIIPGCIAALFIGSLMFLLQPILAITVIVFIILFFVISYPLSRKVRRDIRQFHDYYESFSGGVQRTLQLFDYARSHGLEERELSQHFGRVDGLRRLSGRMALLLTAYQSFHGIGVIILGSIILVFGAYLVLNGAITTGDLISFYAALALLRPFIVSLASNIGPVFAGLESVKDLGETFDLDAVVTPSGRSVDITGRVSAEGIVFSFKNELILDNSSLELVPGTITALTGSLGAGKTTLANIILGLLKPDEGNVEYDDINISELDMVSVRRQVGVVRQNPVLFLGTVRENIAFSHEDPDEYRIVNAAELAGVAGFIEALPNGYETVIGENATKLSGGQRQLLAVARALNRTPQLLILDEPGNHLDSAAYSRLIQSLKQLPWKPAILVITHDRSLADVTDVHYHLENGRTKRVR